MVRKDFKFYGQARDVAERALRVAYVAAIQARTNFTPPEPFHIFAIDVTSAGYVVFGEERTWMTWDPKVGLRTGQQREV